MRLLAEHFQNREILSYAFKCITQYFLDFRRTTVAACAMSEPAVQSTLSARQRGRLDQVVGERQSNRSIVYARIGHLRSCVVSGVSIPQRPPACHPRLRIWYD